MMDGLYCNEIPVQFCIGTLHLIYCCLLQLCERLPSPNGESLVDCNVLSAMPPVSFTIAGKDFKLTPEQVCIERLKSWSSKAE